ncbi:tryptophan-rich sensory protein [Candidatus Pacearchaeota archaeon]|nr:tryptophan-rich sensory protein [Candidatus Pacearchaeota archaeon]
MRFNWKVFAYSLIAVYSIAFLGSIFTAGNSDSAWYDSVKPQITPPNYVFPIVWNILFFLISFSLYFSWTSAKNEKVKTKVAYVFGINLMLNVLWSLFFFGMQNPVLAFFDLIAMLFSILAIFYVTWEINRISSYLIIPYLLWVGFAGFLNYLIAFS